MPIKFWHDRTSEPYAGNLVGHRSVLGQASVPELPVLMTAGLWFGGATT
jgi:hypothetical protein